MTANLCQIRFFAKSCKSVKMALNIKVINETLLKSILLNNFSLWYIWFFGIFESNIAKSYIVVILGMTSEEGMNILFQLFTPSKTTWEKILCGNCFVIEYKALLFRIKSLSERSYWFIEYVVKLYYVIHFKSTYKSLAIDFFTLDGHFGKAMSIY